ncbi:hypothetical protein D3C85_1456620 [compost metagenome]
MDTCHICKKSIDKYVDTFYQEQLVENDKIIPVILCEDCMAELHKCPQCDMDRPYCNECV